MSKRKNTTKMESTIKSIFFCFKKDLVCAILNLAVKVCSKSVWGIYNGI